MRADKNGQRSRNGPFPYDLGDLLVSIFTDTKYNEIEDSGY